MNLKINNMIAGCKKTAEKPPQGTLGI